VFSDQRRHISVSLRDDQIADFYSLIRHGMSR